MEKIKDSFILSRTELAEMVDFFEGIDTFFKKKINMGGYNDYKKLFKRANRLLIKTALKKIDQEELKTWMDSNIITKEFNKIKILRSLSESEVLGFNEIVDKTGSARAAVWKHMKKFVKNGEVEHISRKYRITAKGVRRLKIKEKLLRKLGIV